MLSTTEGALYFIKIETQEIQEIQFVPDELFINRDPGQEPVQIVGRNLPRYHGSGGEKTLAMTLDFFAELESREDVINKCRWFEALTYNEGFEEPQSHVQLVFGELFNTERWTIKQCRYRLSMFTKTFGS
jgi:hypothetical protein